MEDINVFKSRITQGILAIKKETLSDVFSISVQGDTFDIFSYQ